MSKLLVALALSYVAGSIPFSIIISRLFKGIDIRQYGSKNAGATNVYRVLGLLPAILVVILDLGKGFLSTALISQMASQGDFLTPVTIKILCGIFATTGHVFTIFAQFKGGKGVATGTGSLLALIPREIVFAFVLFLVVVALTRYISLGSLLSAVFILVSLVLEKFYLKMNIPVEILITYSILMALVLYTHRSNIKRLLTGREHKFGERVNV